MRRRGSVFASLTLLLLIVGCSAGGLVPTDSTAIIYVIHRDWHTDIGLPVEEIAGPLGILQQPFPKVRFLVFGFGERQFLINRKTTLGDMLNALLPSRSAVLMTALSAPPDRAFGTGNVVALRVTRTGLRQIEAAIWQELETTDASQPVILADGPYPGSVFYAARATYDAFHTCNTWTAMVLRTGGVPMQAGMLFAGQVMAMARWTALNQASALKPQVPLSMARSN